MLQKVLELVKKWPLISTSGFTFDKALESIDCQFLYLYGSIFRALG